MSWSLTLACVVPDAVAEPLSQDSDIDGALVLDSPLELHAICSGDPGDGSNTDDAPSYWAVLGGYPLSDGHTLLLSAQVHAVSQWLSQADGSHLLHVHSAALATVHGGPPDAEEEAWLVRSLNELAEFYVDASQRGLAVLKFPS